MWTSGFSVIKSLLCSDDAPNKVLEVKGDTGFFARGVAHREDGLIMYLPDTSGANKKGKNFFEIVQHRPTGDSKPPSYSVYRSTNREEVESKFFILKDKLPEFLEIAVDMCNVTGIQKICDIILENPKWTMAHLVAHFCLYDRLDNPKVVENLNTADEDEGKSPLQVGISQKNLKMVQMLRDADCSLDHVDHMGNTIYHYAASSTKEIISVLTQGIPQSTLEQRLNEQNKEGYTALHKACLADKPDCVRALLIAGADVNKFAVTGEDGHISPSYVGDFVRQTPSNSLFDADMKNGGTPLHWACSKNVIDALLEMNCHINLGNFKKQTALHVMVYRKRLDCVVALLSRGADPDLGDQDGVRPIHLAAEAGNIPILQALIIFGADIDVANNAGETPRHLIDPKVVYYLAAVGAKRCSDGTPNCREGCIWNATYEGIPPPSVLGPKSRDDLNRLLTMATIEQMAIKYKDKEMPRPGRLLCLDGGGIRGLILVVCLLEIEKTVGKPISHCFDWLAGTSTGGILALGIATGKSMKECLCLYFRLKDQAFLGVRPYPSEPLERVLKETFGAESVMTDIKCPRVMIAATLSDRKPVELHFFRNYDSASRILNDEADTCDNPPPHPENQFIWEAARATGAAPTYFRPFGRFIDGGLISNNPTLDALTEITEHSIALKSVGREDEANPVSLVVSIGTGHMPVIEIKQLDVYRPDSILDNAKLLYGMTSLAAILVEQATGTDGRVVDRARTWCTSIGVPYYRFCPLLSEDYGLNEKDDEKLCRMLWETKVYMKQNFHVIRELADLLK